MGSLNLQEKELSLLITGGDGEGKEEREWKKELKRTLKTELLQMGRPKSWKEQGGRPEGGDWKNRVKMCYMHVLTPHDVCNRCAMQHALKGKDKARCGFPRL